MVLPVQHIGVVRIQDQTVHTIADLLMLPIFDGYGDPLVLGMPGLSAIVAAKDTHSADAAP